MEPTTRTFFTADTRFGHRSIIDFCERSSGAIIEHEERRVAFWNETVAPSDTVPVSDFAHADYTGRARAIFDRLNGAKHLVIGNRNGAATLALRCASLSERELLTREHLQIVLDYSQGPLVARPLRFQYPVLRACACHASRPTERLRDRWDSRPVTFDRVIRRLAKIVRPQVKVGERRA